MSATEAQTRERLLALKVWRRPGEAGPLKGGSVIALALCCAAVTAYAAEPSAADLLPREVVGVVGSGDRLSLRLIQGQEVKSLKVGDDYRDGWKIEAVSPEAATLVKGDQRQKIGLNPTGALAAQAVNAPPSTVQVLGDTLVEREAAEKRFIGLYADWARTNAPSMIMADGSVGMTMTLLQRALGDQFEAFLENDRRVGELRKAKDLADAQAAKDTNKLRWYAGLPVDGPDTVPMPLGIESDIAALAAVGLPRYGYARDPVLSVIGGDSVLVKCFTALAEEHRAFCP